MTDTPFTSPAVEEPLTATLGENMDYKGLPTDELGPAVEEVPRKYTLALWVDVMRTHPLVSLAAAAA